MNHRISLHSPSFKEGFAKGVVQAFDLFGVFGAPREPASARYRRRREASKARLISIAQRNWETIVNDVAASAEPSPR